MLNTRTQSFITTAVIMLLLCLPLVYPSSTQAQGAATLSIPSIDVNAPLQPVYLRQMGEEVTWDVSGLRHTVGVFDKLAPIGTVGNTVLGGHSEQARGEADVFFNLDAVQVGDEVTITHGDNVLRYQVTDVRRVDVRDLSIIQPTTDERLTIMTCDRASYSADGSYAQRVVVIAHRVS